MHHKGITKKTSKETHSPGTGTEFSIYWWVAKTFGKGACPPAGYGPVIANAFG